MRVFAYGEWEVLKSRHGILRAVNAALIPATLGRVCADGGVA